MCKYTVFILFFFVQYSWFCSVFGFGTERNIVEVCYQQQTPLQHPNPSVSSHASPLNSLLSNQTMRVIAEAPATEPLIAESPVPSPDPPSPGRLNTMYDSLNKRRCRAVPERTTMS